MVRDNFLVVVYVDVSFGLFKVVIFIINGFIFLEVNQKESLNFGQFEQYLNQFGYFLGQFE